MSENKDCRIREESEIVAMRDKLERYTLQHAGIGNAGPALAAMRWVCDPRLSDRDVTNYADETPDDEPTVWVALDTLAGNEPDWGQVDEYLSGLTPAERSALAKTARKIGRLCSIADKRNSPSA